MLKRNGKQNHFLSTNPMPEAEPTKRLTTTLLVLRPSPSQHMAFDQPPTAQSGRRIMASHYGANRRGSFRFHTRAQTGGGGNGVAYMAPFNSKCV